MKYMSLSIVLVLLYFLCFPNRCVSIDAITPSQTLRDGQTLVSADETFELGFLSLENSAYRYVGLWFRDIPWDSVVWIANRDSPVADRSGVLTVTETGNVVILANNSVGPVWTSNSTAKSPVLQLLRTGNLVVRDGESGGYAWEGFDHPCDTLIAGMKLGWDLRTGRKWFLSSWKSRDDPTAGNFIYEVDPRGVPQLILRDGKALQYRSGTWDGVQFGGDPLMQSNTIYTPKFVFNETNVYYTFEIDDQSVVTKFSVSPAGLLEQSRWNSDSREWLNVFTLNRQNCDGFGHCGPNGVCDVGRNGLVCRCPDGFAPRDWERFNWSSGCVASPPAECGGGAFMTVPRLKLPYADGFVVERKVVRKGDCRAICVGNCSCTAYSFGRVGGCMLWFGDLLDMAQYSDGGQDLYIRVAVSVLNKNNHKRTIVIITVTVLLSCFLLFVLIGLYVIRKRIRNVHENQDH